MVQFTKSIKVGPPESGALLGPIQNNMQVSTAKISISAPESR